MNPNVEIERQSGENNFESAFANSVSFTFLNKPTYLNSPIALIRKITGINQERIL